MTATANGKELKAINRQIELRRVDQELARRDLFHYVKYTFKKYRPEWENWHHSLICRYLDE